MWPMNKIYIRYAPETGHQYKDIDVELNHYGNVICRKAMLDVTHSNNIITDALYWMHES